MGARGGESVARKPIHPGLAVLKARLHEWLAATRQRDSDFVKASGLSDSTVARLLHQPGYASTADTWRIVARTCGWSEDEVLVTGGFQPSTATPVDGWTLVTQGLTQLGVPVAKQEAVRQMLDLPDAPAPRPNRPGAASNGPS